MIPYEWLLHLEQATNESRFANSAHMERLGFAIETNPSFESRNLNPDALMASLAATWVRCSGCTLILPSTTAI